MNGKMVSGLLVGALLATVVNDHKNFSVWAKDGACAKDFNAEAGMRGFGDIINNKVTLSADKPNGLCNASFVDRNGGNVSFSWKANQGQHIPVPLAEQLGAIGISSPSASAP